jgi:hypothetical protein
VYISSETLEQILSDAAKSRAAFSLRQGRKPFSIIFTISLISRKNQKFRQCQRGVEIAMVNMNLAVAMDFTRLTTPNPHTPIKTPKRLSKKDKKYKEKQKAFDENSKSRLRQRPDRQRYNLKPSFLSVHQDARAYFYHRVGFHGYDKNPVSATLRISM